MKLDKMPKLNKFKTWRTQLNESKIRKLKWIFWKIYKLLFATNSSHHHSLFTDINLHLLILLPKTSSYLFLFYFTKCAPAYQIDNRPLLPRVQLNAQFVYSIFFYCHLSKMKNKLWLLEPLSLSLVCVHLFLKKNLLLLMS